jgi:phenylpropionate dioxygenase-like ring-hydroxylating dioxygenase large terminal subunit
LSRGRLVGERLECAYHGWQYDREGICRLVPALCDGGPAQGQLVPAYPVIEQQGYVWVFATPGPIPAIRPFLFPHLGEAGYTSVRFDFQVEATLHATLENQLDVPHTAFLHRGLFRGGKRNRITAVVRRWRHRVEAEYIGEPPPRGLAARLLAVGQEGNLAHFDRFLLPSISQVEYRLGAQSHLIITNALTPVSDFTTRFSSVVSFRVPLPGILVRWLLTPIARRILEQDRRILKLQTESVRRFGTEQYVSTEVDLLGPHIWRLLREAEQGGAGAAGEGAVIEKHIELLV